jgi:hypothetical protein
MKYALSDTQLLMWRLCREFPINVCCVATISDDFNEAQILEALDAVKNRHQILQVGVSQVNGQDKPTFVKLSNSIPFIFSPDLNLAEEINLQLVLPFTHGESGDIDYLWRFIAGPNRGGKGTDLLLIFEHTIGDGMSGAFFFRDLITALRKRPLKQLPWVAPIDERVPQAIKKRSLKNNEQPCDLKPNEKASIRLTSSTAKSLPPELLPKIRFWELDQIVVERIKRRSHTKSVSLHGVITGAFLSVICEVLENEEKRKLSCLSPLNLRNDLEPPVQDEFGEFIARVVTTHDVAQVSSKNFWDLAIDIKSQITAARDNLAVFESVTQASQLIKESSPLPITATIGENETQAVADLVSSNLGLLDFINASRENNCSESSFSNNLSLSQFRFTVTGIRQEAFILCFSSLNGKLFGTLRTFKHLTSAAQANLVISKALATLSRL